jgi:hypothetical protein
MAYKSVVYHPPGRGFPYLAVVVNEETGDIVVATSVASQAEGEAILIRMANDLVAGNYPK